MFAPIFCYFIILSAPGASSGAKLEINKITRAVAGWLEVLSVSVPGKISNNGDTTCYYSPALPTINNMARDSDNWE